MRRLIFSVIEECVWIHFGEYSDVLNRYERSVNWKPVVHSLSNAMSISHFWYECRL